MVRLTDRFIFLPTSLVVLGLDCSVERVRTRSVDRTFSSAAARASWAFFSSLKRDAAAPVKTAPAATGGVWGGGASYFWSSAFLNFSALSSTRSWSALILAAVRSTGCLMRSDADGRLPGSGWIMSCGVGKVQ